MNTHLESHLCSISQDDLADASLTSKSTNSQSVKSGFKVYLKQQGYIETDEGLEIPRMLPVEIPLLHRDNPKAFLFGEECPQDIFESLHRYRASNRKIRNLSQLCCMHVAFKFSSLSLDRQYLQYAREVIRPLENAGLPLPTRVIYEGKGIMLIWDFEPVPKRVQPRWRALQRNIAQTLNNPQLDWTRLGQSTIVRVDGSVNSHPDLAKEIHDANPRLQNPNPIVTSLNLDFLHPKAYRFEELANAFFPRERGVKFQVNAKRRRYHLEGFKSRTVTNLIHARFDDFKRIHKARKSQKMSFEMQEQFFFIAANTATWNNGVSGFISKMHRLAKELVPDLSSHQVKRIGTQALDRLIKSQSLEKGEPDPRFKFTNAMIIKALDITPMEQQGMKTIISDVEKARRHAIQSRRYRAKKGAVTRAQYLSEADKRRQEALRLNALGFTWDEIALRLGYSTGKSAKGSCRGYQLRKPITDGVISLSEPSKSRRVKVRVPCTTGFPISCGSYLFSRGWGANKTTKFASFMQIGLAKPLGSSIQTLQTLNPPKCTSIQLHSKGEARSILPAMPPLNH